MLLPRHPSAASAASPLAAQADIVKADRLPAVLAALERMVKASTSAGGKAPQQAASAPAAQLTLRRAGDSVYLCAGACSYKFAILSNDRLLA